MQDPRPKSHREKVMEMMQGQSEMDQNDVQTIAMMEDVMRKRGMMPLEQDAARGDIALNAAKTSALSDEGATLSRRGDAEMMQSIGSLGHGLASSGVQYPDEIMIPLLERYGLYHSDLQAEIRRKAAEQAMSPEQLVSLQQKLLPPSTRK